MTRRGIWIVLPVVFFLGVLECAGQGRPQPDLGTTRTFVLSGTVRHADTLEAIDMVKVDLLRFTGETVSTMFSRSTGDFEFGGLMRGNYTISISEDGYEPVRETVEIINGDRRGVMIYLTRKPSEVQKPGGQVSARELALPAEAREAYEKGTQRLYDKKDPKGSLPHFQRVLKVSPDFYEAYYQLGVGYLKMGKEPEAEAAFRKSIEMSKGEYSDPHFGLAAILCNREQFLECETETRRGLVTSPNAWLGLYHQARAFVGMNRLDDAQKNLDLVVRMQPDFAEPYLVYANIFIRKKDYNSLLHALDEYLRLQPSGPMSENVRQMRDSVQQQLKQAKKNP